MKKTLLGKSGIIRTAPDEVAFSPRELGGAGLHRTEIDQTIDHVKMLVHHGSKNTVTGLLLRNSMEQLAIEIGLGGDPLSFSLDNISYATPNTWIENTIRCCRKYDIDVASTVQGLLEWTNQDGFIMERAAKMISGKELASFNHVRLYLKVATISDIVAANGFNVDDDLIKGKRGNSPSPSSTAYTWPSFPPPSQKETDLWALVIRRMFGINNTSTFMTYGRQGWLKAIASSHVRWNLDIEEGCVLEKIDDQWQIWEHENLCENVRTRSAETYKKIT